MDALDDQFTGAGNKQQTQNAVDKDFALVGSFSLEDSFGETVVAQNPQVPVVSTLLAPTLNSAAEHIQRQPQRSRVGDGAARLLQEAVSDTDVAYRVLASTFPSALASWKLEEPVLKQAGYKIVYYTGVPLTQTDFTQNVVEMKSDGVQLVYIDQLPENYAGALLRR